MMLSDEIERHRACKEDGVASTRPLKSLGELRDLALGYEREAVQAYQMRMRLQDTLAAMRRHIRALSKLVEDV